MGSLPLGGLSPMGGEERGSITWPPGGAHHHQLPCRKMLRGEGVHVQSRSSKGGWDGYLKQHPLGWAQGLGRKKGRGGRHEVG
jgi:hypothetical protein